MPGGYVQHVPTPKQTAFLVVDELEVFYGGAAGGGKSDALLMSALEYVDVPGYAAILFRKTFADLELPGGLLERSKEWLGGTAARWNERLHAWSFPSGATVGFGYLATETDKYRYKSAEFQFIGFDELTQFSESQYRYLFSRLRRPSGLVDDEPLAKVPLRMRSASNPGDRGHAWVKARFLPMFIDQAGTVLSAKAARGRDDVRVVYPRDEDGRRRIFIPARLDDNPHLDRETYRTNLRRLDPLESARLEAGDWDVTEGGKMFPRDRVKILQSIPRGIRKWARAWDLAATDADDGDDPDWTAGVKLGRDPESGLIVISDVVRGRWGAGAVERVIRTTAEADGRKETIQRMEQEPGSAGKTVIAHYRAKVLPGYDFKGVPSSGPKAVRAIPLSSQWEAGNVALVAGAWNAAYLDEMEAFPSSAEGVHDDQVDASSGAFDAIVGYKRRMAALGVDGAA